MARRGGVLELVLFQCGEIRYGVGKVALVVPGETVEYGVIGGRPNRDPLARMVAGCTGE